MFRPRSQARARSPAHSATLEPPNFLSLGPIPTGGDLSALSIDGHSVIEFPTAAPSLPSPPALGDGELRTWRLREPLGPRLPSAADRPASPELVTPSTPARAPSRLTVRSLHGSSTLDDTANVGTLPGLRWRARSPQPAPEGTESSALGRLRVQVPVHRSRSPSRRATRSSVKRREPRGSMTRPAGGWRAPTISQVLKEARGTVARDPEDAAVDAMIEDALHAQLSLRGEFSAFRSRLDSAFDGLRNVYVAVHLAEDTRKAESRIALRLHLGIPLDTADEEFAREHKLLPRDYKSPHGDFYV